MTLKENLIAHLREIVRDRDPYLASEGHFYVQNYICQQFSRWGKVEAYQFSVRGRVHSNWILNLANVDGVIVETDSPKSDAQARSTIPILIGAHYDTVPGSAGADDNGTGLAVLLEFAQIFATTPAKHPIRLVAFDLEESGLHGSRQYATHLHQHQQPLRLMLSLEMLGYCDRTPNSQRYPAGLQYFYPNQGDFIALIGNWQTIPDLLRLSRSMRRGGGVSCQWLPAGSRGMIVPDTRRSDHAPFWDEGYRALMVTDTAHLRNPHYHKSSDRMETLDLDFLTNVCQGLAEGIRRL